MHLGILGLAGIVIVEDKRVIVTGGDGFLGHHLMPLLQKEYSDVFAIKHEDYDLLREDRVKSMYRNLKPDIVIHLAARVGGCLLYTSPSPRD